MNSCFTLLTDSVFDRELIRNTGHIYYLVKPSVSLDCSKLDLGMPVRLAFNVPINVTNQYELISGTVTRPEILTKDGQSFDMMFDWKEDLDVKFPNKNHQCWFGWTLNSQKEIEYLKENRCWIVWKNVRVELKEGK